MIMRRKNDEGGDPWAVSFENISKVIITYSSRFLATA